MSDVVQKLRNYLADNPDFKEAFEAAFFVAKHAGIPEFDQFGINTFDDYIDWYEKLLNWTPSETIDGRNIYYHLCLFYFVLDLDPIRAFQTPILPTSTPPWKWLSDWLIEYAVQLGLNCDKPGSITPETLKTFYDSPLYHMNDYPVPPGGWNTFNQFFSRKIDLSLRPIDDPDDPRVIVSPADSVFDGSWNIQSDSNVVIKGIPWPIDELLRNTKFADRFKGGKFMHSFLAPNDYHRQHTPVSGTVVEKKNIPGLCYLEVHAKADAQGRIRLGMKRNLDAPDTAGYQFLQARGLIMVDNPVLGLVAVLPIGMAQVSSVVITVNEGDVLKKGDEVSYFQMGGSDIVCVFEAAANVQFTAELNVHYNVGKQIAIANTNYKHL